MKVTHLELSAANDFVEKLHRHHKPVRGHRFSLGALNGIDLVGVVIAGRPVARAVDYKTVIEVTRLCTDGAKNACSFLYAAAARAASALGYEKIQTYILESEPGTSLKAAGWEFESNTSGGSWNCIVRTGRREDQPLECKQRWVKRL